MNTNIIAEIGINHNGDLDLAKKLIDISSVAGCKYVKFQKRTPDLCVPEDQKNKIRETPWGKITYLEYKNNIEFGKKEYDEIDRYCKDKKIKWFASVWDKPSADFISNYVDISKVPSALITNIELCKYTRSKFKTFLVSTGMSTEEQIEKCVYNSNPDVIFHTNSTYPCPVKDLNLNYIKHLKNKYPNKIIGYSGHEYGLVPTFVAVALGCSWIERHVTLERTLWGSDQMSSLEPGGLIKMCKGIADIELSLGTNSNRIITTGEHKKLKSLRG